MNINLFALVPAIGPHREMLADALGSEYTLGQYPIVLRVEDGTPDSFQVWWPFKWSVDDTYGFAHLDDSTGEVTVTDGPLEAQAAFEGEA